MISIELNLFNLATLTNSNFARNNAQRLSNPRINTFGMEEVEYTQVGGSGSLLDLRFQG